MFEKFNEQAEKICKDLGYILYDIEYLHQMKMLRLYIMDPNTNTAVIDDCVKVDHAFSPFMDETAWVPEEIVLEVSSPGLYRSLKTSKHFELALNTPITLSLKKNLGEIFPGEFDKKISKLKKVTAVLKEYTDEAVTVEFNEDLDIKINHNDIKKANLEPEVQGR